MSEPRALELLECWFGTLDAAGLPDPAVSQRWFRGGPSFDQKLRARFGHDVAAALPAMIYPNPLNPNRYVVINSGHTFGEAEFRGTNALLFPRLGDWGVLSTADESIISSGYFDEEWR